MVHNAHASISVNLEQKTKYISFVAHKNSVFNQRAKTKLVHQKLRFWFPDRGNYLIVTCVLAYATKSNINCTVRNGKKCELTEIYGAN